jgi:hypothetical protein
MKELLKKFYDAGVMHEATLNKKYSFEQVLTDNYQSLQLQQTGVIKSVCGNCERKKLYIKKQCYCGYCGDRLKT